MHSNSGDGHLPLLHIDDSADDRLLVQEAISLTKTPFTFYEADGLDAAMPYFMLHTHDGEPEKHPLPALVLLDYDLGKNTGLDFLYWLRILKRIKFIPIVMFSGSPGKKHVEQCYATGANHFLTKPTDLARLKTIVRMLHTSVVCNIPGPIHLLKEYRAAPTVA